MAEDTLETVYAGPAGWSYKDWEGIVYPAPRPSRFHPLELLSEWFDTVEVNATFYYPPNPRFCASWLGKVKKNPRFLFTFKLWEQFTHKRDTWPGTQDIRAVIDGMAPIREAGKLGALLVQFPWSFRRTPENREWLNRIAEAFAAYPLAVELRHSSWERAEVVAAFRARGIAFCNIDQPLFDDSIGPASRVTAALGYVRFHGRNYEHWFREGSNRDARYDYLYSEEELKPWLDRIREMRAQVERLFVVTNNHYRGQAVANALEIQAALGKVRASLSPGLLRAFPRLQRLDGGSAVFEQ